MKFVRAYSAISLTGLFLLILMAIAAAQTRWIETPELEERVSSGQLPPVQERLPENPHVVDFEAQNLAPGQHGGQMRLLMGKSKDIRMMTVYGYARLVVFDTKLNLVPDILESFEVYEGRIFTFHLRPGHKWSDGAPFTTEDFRYFWEDIANNIEIYKSGPPIAMLVNGKPPVFEVIDALTVRYTWEAPNPEFLPALAGARPMYIYQPSHYMRQFHPAYQDPDRLAEMVEEVNKRNWVGLHIIRGRQYRPVNPDLPSLQPWVNSTSPPASQFIFLRNPFYHRVDNHGRQLPYIDRVVLNMGSSKIIPAKTGAGESDLQARYLRFDNYTFLKEAEERQDFKVRLWQTAKGAQIALFPNLNLEDEGWRDLFQNADFRRALSLGIDRHEINQVVYYGLFRESANTVLPVSPLYRQEYADAWTEFDPETANKMLDALGLDRRNEDGIRMMEDGRLLEIIVETAGESTEETDVLELIGDSWRQIGIKIFVRSTQRDIFRNRIFSGLTMMSTWQGLSNGIPTPAMTPAELAPTEQQHLQWPKWGQYMETSGQSGEKPDDPHVLRLIELYHAWQLSPNDEERTRNWHEMLAIHADQVFTIGVVNGSLQPVVISNRLKNVPETGFYNWDPGAYFGIYKPDTFWLEEASQ